MCRGRPFRRGTDPRRHQLTQEERRRGGQARWRQLFREMAKACGMLWPDGTEDCILGAWRAKGCRGNCDP